MHPSVQWRSEFIGFGWICKYENSELSSTHDTIPLKGAGKFTPSFFAGRKLQEEDSEVTDLEDVDIVITHLNVIMHVKTQQSLSIGAQSGTHFDKQFEHLFQVQVPAKSLGYPGLNCLFSLGF